MSSQKINWARELYRQQFGEEIIRKHLCEMNILCVIKTQRMSEAFIDTIIIPNLETAEELDLNKCDIMWYQKKFT